MEEIEKRGKIGNFGQKRAPMPHIENPRCDVDLHQGVGYPHNGEAEVAKWHPSDMPRRSSATPRRNYCSQRAIFGLLFRKSSFHTLIV